MVFRTFAVTLTASIFFYARTSLVIIPAHPVSGESHNQRNTTGEVATTSPPFYNEPHQSHVLCVKAELRTTFTSWLQHHFFCDRKSRAACAQSFAPWQQATIEIMLAISLTTACSRYTYDGVILPAHPVRGESHNQRNTTGEVATLQSSAQQITKWLPKSQNVAHNELKNGAQ